MCQSYVSSTISSSPLSKTYTTTKSALKSTTTIGSQNQHSSKLAKIFRGTRSPLGGRKQSSPNKGSKNLRDSKNESNTSISIKTPRIKLQQQHSIPFPAPSHSSPNKMRTSNHWEKWWFSGLWKQEIHNNPETILNKSKRSSRKIIYALSKW